MKWMNISIRSDWISLTRLENFENIVKCLAAACTRQILQQQTKDIDFKESHITFK